MKKLLRPSLMKHFALAGLVVLAARTKGFADTAILLHAVNAHVVRGGYDLGWQRLPIGTRVTVLQKDAAGQMFVETADQVTFSVPEGDLHLIPAPNPTPVTAPPSPISPAAVARPTPIPPDRPDSLLKITNDRFTGDQTITLASPIKVTEDMVMTMMALIPDKTTDLSNLPVVLIFARHGAEWRYLDYHPLHLLIDGSRLDLGDTKHKGNVITGAGVSEHMTAMIDRKKFVAIACAQNLEAKLGSTEFSVPYSARRGMQQFAEMLIHSPALEPSPAPAPSASVAAIARVAPAIAPDSTSREADARNGLQEGRRIGNRRYHEGFPKPNLDYLDHILAAVNSDQSEAWKTGFKGGYLSAWDNAGSDLTAR